LQRWSSQIKTNSRQFIAIGITVVQVKICLAKLASHGAGASERRSLKARVRPGLVLRLRRSIVRASSQFKQPTILRRLNFEQLMQIMQVYRSPPTKRLLKKKQRKQIKKKKRKKRKEAKLKRKKKKLKKEHKKERQGIKK